MVLIDWWNLPAMTSREILGFSSEEWQNKSANAKKHPRENAHLKIPTIIFEFRLRLVSSQNESGPADARGSWYTDILIHCVNSIYIYMIYTYILNLDISTNSSLHLGPTETGNFLEAMSRAHPSRLLAADFAENFEWFGSTPNEDVDPVECLVGLGWCSDLFRMFSEIYGSKNTLRNR